MRHQAEPAPAVLVGFAFPGRHPAERSHPAVVEPSAAWALALSRRADIRSVSNSASADFSATRIFALESCVAVSGSEKLTTFTPRSAQRASDSKFFQATRLGRSGFQFATAWTEPSSIADCS